MTDEQKHDESDEINLKANIKDGFSLNAKGASAAGVRIGVSVAIVILSLGVVIAGAIAAYMVAR